MKSLKKYLNNINNISIVCNTLDNESEKKSIEIKNEIEELDKNISCEIYSKRNNNFKLFENFSELKEKSCLIFEINKNLQ